MNDYQVDPKQDEAGGFTGRGFTGEDGGLVEDGEYGEGLGSDPLVAGDGPKRRNSAPLVLVLVVGLAIAGLFAMHTVNKVAGSAGTDPGTEQIVDRFLSNGPVDPDDVLKPMDGEDEEVLDALKADYTELQVGKLLRVDPFPVTDTPTLEQGSGTPARMDQVARAAKMLSVKMIIMGSSPLANINGRIVKTNGDVDVILKGEGTIRFKVMEITADTVTIQAPPVEEGEEPFTKTLFLNKRR